jgi:GxxExxY protein
LGDQSYVDSRYPLSGLAAKVLAAAHEVHRVFGPGFEEVVYQRALVKEFPVHDVECAREV